MRARFGVIGTWALAGTLTALAIIGLTLIGCAIGPNYSPEPAPVPTEYKELKGWKRANPRDGADRGDWWKVYKDHALNTLLPQVEISNQTVAAAAAAYEDARAIIREAQAALFPIGMAGYSVTRIRTGNKVGGGTRIGGTPSAIYTTVYSAPISGTWDLDVWGRVRRQIEANTSGAQASAADLDNVRLAAQAQLAIAYFDLRAADSLIALLASTITEYNSSRLRTNSQRSVISQRNCNGYAAQSQINAKLWTRS